MNHVSVLLMCKDNILLSHPCPRSTPSQDGKKMRVAVAVLLLFLGKMTLAQDEILLSSHQIPAYFVLGAGTSAYQVYIHLPLVTYLKVDIN